MDSFENICKIVLFLSVLLILFSSTDFQEFDSKVFKGLYHKFRILSKNESELNVLQNLFKINKRIIGFDYEFESQTNATKLKPKWIEDILFDFITKSVQKILNFVDIRDILDGPKRGFSTSASCLACHSLVSFLFNIKIPVRVLINVIIGFCSTLKIPNISINVCKGYTKMFKDHLEYIRHNTHLKQSEICGVLLGVHCFMKSGNCFNSADPLSTNLCWKLNLSQKRSPVGHRPRTQQNNQINRILFLTDIHVDPDYVASNNRNCGQPYCCRAGMQNDTLPEQSSESGYWGSYFCDPPIHLVENLFETIEWQTIDLVYWAGDVSSHDSWADTWDRTTEASKIISKLLRKHSQSPVVSAIGNHISIPIGTFSPPNIENQLSSKRIYEELAEEWSQWLTSEALTTFLRAGYYVWKIRPGFRIIVMNTNYCARLNIWTLYRSIDPADHLKWLIDQLSAAENAGDSVHIVGHIPPDNRECTQSWLYNYMAIIERYSLTIVGQFYGHTHRDEFRFIHSNSDCNKPIGFEILSPSFSPYDGELRLNPAFRVISTTNQGLIVDIQTFTFELDVANAEIEAKPEWNMEYSMAAEYSISFDVHQFDQLLETMIRDNYYLQKFYSHYSRSDRNDYCNTDCKTIILKDMNVCNAFDSISKPITSVG